VGDAKRPTKLDRDVHRGGRAGLGRSMELTTKFPSQKRHGAARVRARYLEAIRIAAAMHNEVAEKICHLPQVYEAGDCSTATLLEESGFVEQPDSLDEGQVETILREEPALAELWLQRSGDQRLVSGWVLDCLGGAYYLKNFSSGSDSHFADRNKACAAFIVRYVGRIRRVLLKHELTAA
jgi:hypothetical protein